MALIFKSNGSTTIKDFIIRSFKVPLSCGRNRNGTHIIGEFDIIVSGEVGGAHIVLGSAIEVYTVGSTYPSFIGTLAGSVFDRARHEYTSTIRDELRLLTEKNIGRDNLNGLLTAGTGIEYGLDGHGYPSVQVLFIIEQMFSDVGLTFFDLSASSLASETVETINFESVERVILFKHLRVDTNMLYVINQSFAGRDGTGTQTSDNQRISYWDFISDFCSHFDLHIYLSQDGTAKEYRIGLIDNTGVTLSDGIIFSHKITSLIAKGGGWIVRHRFSDNRTDYVISGEQDLDQDKNFKEGDGLTAISVKNNLVYFYNKFWVDNYEVIWGTNDDDGAYDNGHCYTGQQMAGGLKKSTQSDLEILKRKIPLAQKYVDFRLNNAVLSESEQLLETVYES